MRNWTACHERLDFCFPQTLDEIVGFNNDSVQYIIGINMNDGIKVHSL